MNPVGVRIRSAVTDIAAPYLAPEQRELELDRLANTTGGSVFEFGRSVEGRPLRALRIHPLDGDPSARILCCANIHGLEYVGGLVAFGLARYLAGNQPDALALRRRAEVLIVPCLNPDGYARTWTSSGHGTLRELRVNARGVDLNRNYPRPNGHRPSLVPGSGSSRPGSATYRGPMPLSEPETTALDALCERERFVASVNLHSYLGCLIPAFVAEATQFNVYRRLCGSFRNAQRTRRYTTLASRRFDVFTGEQEDHQHHHHGTWAVCVETFSVSASFAQHLLAPCLFWRFNPRDPQPWIANDVPAIVALYLTALEHGAATIRCSTTAVSHAGTDL